MLGPTEKLHKAYFGQMNLGLFVSLFRTSFKGRSCVAQTSKDCVGAAAFGVAPSDEEAGIDAAAAEPRAAMFDAIPEVAEEEEEGD